MDLIAWFAVLCAILCSSNVWASHANGRWNFDSTAPFPSGLYRMGHYKNSIYMLYDAIGKEVSNPNPRIDTIWICDTDSLLWTPQLTTGQLPASRDGSTLSIDPENDGILYLFGGLTGDGFLNDFYTLSLKSFEWKVISPSSSPPGKRFNAYSFVYKGNFFVIGGNNPGGLTDVWSYNPEKNSWKIIMDSGSKVKPQFAMDGAFSDGKYYIYGGCGVLETVCYAQLIVFDVEKSFWEETVQFDVLSQSLGSAKIYNNTLYAIAGFVDGSFIPTSFPVTKIDLKTKSIMSHNVFTTKLQSLYPVRIPSGQVLMTSLLIGDKFYCLGGLNMASNNHLWIYDPGRDEWAANNLNQYPLPRIGPCMTTISENEFGVFGGLYLNAFFAPINDLWTYNPETRLWKRLSQESMCPTTQYDCVPSVFGAAFSYFNGSFFVLGGFTLSPDVSPVARKFITAEEKWVPIVLSDPHSFLVCLRYMAAFKTIGSNLFIWGGQDPMDNIATPEVAIFDMQTNKMDFGYQKTSMIQGASKSIGFDVDGSFCVMGNITSSTGFGNSIWCFNKTSLSWSRLADIPRDIVTQDSYMQYYVNLVSFGGNDPKTGPANQFFMFDAHANELGNLGGYVKPMNLYGGSSVVSNGIMYIFSGMTYTLSTAASNSLFSFKLADTWCSGTQTITPSSKTLEDGSGRFKYFPGTDCTWNVYNATYIRVDSVDIGDGASLLMENMDVCSQPMVLNNSNSSRISVGNKDQGSVVYTPSKGIRIRFVVSMNVETHEGFSLSLYDCKLGFDLDNKGCVCSAGRYINSLGDCIVCPPGTTQSQTNQYECNTNEIFQETINMAEKKVLPGEMVEMSTYLPPLSQSNMAVVRDTIYVAGGYSIIETEGNTKYSSMGTVYATNRLYNSKWKRIQTSGDIPSARVDFCFLGVGDVVVLIGGKTQEPDLFIYHFNTTKSTWIKTTENTDTRIGSICGEYKSSVYVFGGTKSDGDMSDDVQVYSPGSKTLTNIATNGNAPRMSHAGGGIWMRHLYVFGGWNGVSEQGTLYKLDIESMTWLNNKTVELDSCIECDQDKGVCDFSRQRMVSGVIGNKMHVYGGISNGQTLADVLVIELDSGIVIKRENYGIFSPRFPLTNPPPKSAAVGGIFGNQMVVMGGVGNNGMMGNDVWSWDTDLQTWSDSSIFRVPIHRSEAGIVKESDQSFIIFGGSTIYIGETLLNDMWRFNTTTNSWGIIERESGGEKPYGRAGAMMGLYNNKVFVFGGRTSVRVDDHFLWSYDLDTKAWSYSDVTSSLRGNERPFNRVGAQCVQIGKYVWIWGGQLAMGLENVERYASIFVMDLEKYTIQSKTSRNIDPRIRQYHGLVQTENHTISMIGGESFAGSFISDVWDLDSDKLEWKNLRVPVDGMKLSRSVSLNINGNLVGFGSGASDTSSAWMIQRGYGVGSSLHVESILPGYDLISGQNGVAMKDRIIMFGGKRGSTMTNQVIAYKPGFCNSRTPTILESSIIPSFFDDGSGSGRYLTNTDCSWILKDATQLSINFTIRSTDSIHVYRGLDENESNLLLAANKEGSINTYILKSTNGFMIRLRSSGYGINPDSENTNEPCSGCEGFVVTYAKCPSHSSLNTKSNSCDCDYGYSKYGDVCTKDSKSAPNILLGSIIGGLLGIIFLCAGYAGYRYRKRMREMNQKEKQLYAHVDYEDLEIGKLMGSGSFGDVYAGQWRGTDVAIKKLNFKKVTQEALAEFEHEIQVMVELRHPNLVLYMGACVKQPNLCIISELMTRGSLYDALHDSELEIDYSMKMSLLMDAAKGLQYLHTSNPPILHRDLKSPNLLLDMRWNLKISDFGLSGVKDTRSKDDPPPGTLLWMAPEIINNKEYKKSADVYSFSIIMWEVFTRCEPYPGEIAIAVAYRVCEESYRPTIPSEEDMPQQIRALMEKCWDQDEVKRPSFSTIVTELSMSSGNRSSMAFSSSFSVGKSMNNSNTKTEAPVGQVTIVLTEIEGYKSLWDTCPEEMSEALSVHNNLLRANTVRHKGYESRADGGSFVLAFSHVSNAVSFAVELQEMMLMCEWPEGILKTRYAEIVTQSKKTIFKGLRIRMGIHTGEPLYKKEQETNHTIYFGDVISQASRIRDLSKGGQILISESVYEDLKQDSNVMSNLSVRDLSDHALQVSTEASKLFEILPRGLETRAEYFAEDAEFEQDSSSMQIPSIGNIQDWQIKYEDVSASDRVLGQGSYGVVYLGEFQGRQVAIKKFLKQKMDEKRYFSFLAEIMLLRNVKHRNVITLYGACVKAPNICLVMEYAEFKSLSDILLQQKYQIGAADQKSIIIQVSEAMKYLHGRSPPIIHRDLKSANVMVFSLEPIVVKVGDFGLARAKADNQTMTKCGTRAWIAPEILKGLRYTEKADVFSFGILIWEVLSRERPYGNEDPLRINMGIVNGLRPLPIKGSDPKLSSLMNKCWDADSNKRPTFEEITQELKN